MSLGKTNKEAGEAQILSPEMACYHAVHKFPGGVPAMAAVIGCKKATLQNKLNPTQDSHKLTLAEAMHILRITRDFSILDAITHEVDCVWLERSRIEEPAGDVDLLKSITELTGAAHELGSSLVQGLEDGNISRDEYQQLELLLFRLMQAGHLIPALAAQFRA